MCAHLGKTMDNEILWKDQRPWGGAGSTSRVLHTALECCTQQTTETSPLTWSLGPPLSLPHLRNQLTPSWRAREQRNLLLVHPCCNRGPNKALPKFSIWPLVSFYWLRMPITWRGTVLWRQQQPRQEGAATREPGESIVTKAWRRRYSKHPEMVRKIRRENWPWI